MIDILFLAKNRVEFTRVALQCLAENTDWEIVHQVWLYDDGSDGPETLDLFESFSRALGGLVEHVEIVRGQFGGPVAVMNEFLRAQPRDLFAKIDNDVAVPPGWLGVCLEALHAHDVELLGVEVMAPAIAEPYRHDEATRGYTPAEHIGGIGLFNARIFRSSTPRPAGPGGRFGFTAWQYAANPRRGWLTPPLPFNLLDRTPCEPFRSLSEGYVRQGIQRDWGFYGEAERHIWGWTEKYGISSNGQAA